MRLREYTAARAVPRYSCAISPGKHCPLFGAGAVLRGIGGITLLYLGTQDCVYYAQKAALEHRLSAPRGAESSRVLALQLSDADLIFGIRPQLEQLLEREARRAGTRGVFLVTSCSVELLSEDLQSVVDAVGRRTGKTLALIPTEHFRTFSYFEGMEAALSALVRGLKPRPPQARAFAVLGVRHRGAERAEPVRFLQERGYTLQSILPYEASLDQIEALPGVSFTLVLDGTGLGVARSLQSEFGIPFVRFDQKLDLDRITEAWRQLARLTGEPLASWIGAQRREAAARSEALRPLVGGKTFFYSQVILYPFETCLFLSRLGMIPTCIFLGSVLDHTDESRLALAGQADPLLLQNASSDAVEAMLAEQTPDYFIGAAGQAIRRYPVRHVNFRTIPVEAGFSFYRSCLSQLGDAAGAAGEEYAR